MKKIEAIIRPEKLEAVQNILQLVGYGGMMVTEFEGHGRQKGAIQQWRGKEYRQEYIPKIKIEIVINDKDVEETILAIISNARTGDIGDGKIFVYNIEDAIRIRTGERGEKAL